MQNINLIYKNFLELDKNEINIIEFSGSPGAGKSYVSSRFYEDIKEHSYDSNYHTIDIFVNKKWTRLFYKLYKILKLALLKMNIILGGIRIVRIFRNLKVVDRLRLIINLLYICSVVHKNIKMNKLLILDQGIIQALWSCIFYNGETFDRYKLKKYLEMLFNNLGITSMIIYDVKSDKSKIVSRLRTRKLKGSSPLNSLDEAVIEKGIITQETIIEILQDIRKTSNNKILLEEVQNS